MIAGPSSLAVLIVDDASVVRRIVTMTLREMPELNGATIDEAENGKVAFGKLRIRTYNLIISEVQVQGIDGVALVRRVREELQDLRTPILLISRLEDDAGSEAGLAAGASGFVPQPLSPFHIKCAVQHILTREPGGTPR
jgi:CheY-like chemotaxis protein